jgi:DNA-binding protein HU-beta
LGLKTQRCGEIAMTRAFEVGRVAASILSLETISVNTAQLADQIAAQGGITKAQAKTLVDAFLDAIRDAAAKGEEVSLPGFGKFKVQAKPARTGRNPSTGEAIQIAASKKLVFQPAKVLKDAVNG